MTVNEFPLPDLGEGLTEGEIIKWLVAEGDLVELNQPIVEVETAKAAVEIPAKWAGRVVRIHHPEGAAIEVGTVIITINTDPGSTVLTVPVPAAPAAPAPAAAPADTGMSGRTAVLVGYGPRTTAPVRRARVRPGAEATTVQAGPVLAKPPVRKLARDLGVDLAQVTGTGPQGSITRDDVHSAVAVPSAEPVVSTVGSAREVATL
ncbi:MAG TPA: biotin/lipoyl-containing protein, partial [Jatrophihabitans sp.]|nr:biotin/lipoyl-containing protein [Jatrophihabitans sp.]